MAVRRHSHRVEHSRRILILEYMLMAREFDLAMLRLYRQGKAFGGVYSQIGNEAVSVCSALALDRSIDVLFPMHRDIGAHFVFGQSPEQLALNYLARQGSQMRGTDGTGHYADPELRIYGNVSHLGAMVPVAAGFALAATLRGEKTVALTYIGDGGAQVGEVHEALNFASVQRLPLILIIENNQYAYSTPNSKEYACAKLSDRALGYGIEGVTIDGTDPDLVLRTCIQAVKKAREGHGPTIIETVTMRMRGHAEHDDYSYVPKELLSEWDSKDPVNNFLKRLQDDAVLDEVDINKMTTAIRERIVSALDAAVAAPWPEPEEAFRNVFMNPYRPSISGWHS